ncbi:MAG: hypothetical protein RIK87_13775 [Fuerstiella sp.]
MTARLQHFVALSLLSATGCALFHSQGNDLLNPREPLNPEQVMDFESDVPVRRVVRLETCLMSALATDRRVRQHVWEELDESGLMSPEDRRRLNQSGIRVGVSGGTVPWALTSLRQGVRIEQPLVPTSHVAPASRQQIASFGSHVAIPEGSSSLLELRADTSPLIIPAGNIAGMMNGRELENARCVLELKPVEYGDRWVVIRFLPQIHHGSVTTRYNISAGAEQMPVRQKIQPLYEQQFELKLHINETVVIGHQEQTEWTVGRMLFQSDSLTARNERLIALQLADVEKVSGQKSLHVSYSKY